MLQISVIVLSLYISGSRQDSTNEFVYFVKSIARYVHEVLREKVVVFSGRAVQ